MKINSKTKGFILFLLLICLQSVNLLAQNIDTNRIVRIEKKINYLEQLHPLKISGYMQAQYQYGQGYADLKVGGPNPDFNKNYNRIGIRSTRLNLAYEKEPMNGVLEVDLTEKGLLLKKAFLQLKNKQLEQCNIKIGMMNRPFGYEIERSSALREPPEHSLIYNTLLPDEKDIGAMITLQTNKTSEWNFIKLDAGIFAGNATKIDIKNKKDFIGKISFYQTLLKKLQINTGISYYRGNVYQGTKNVYTFSSNSYLLNNDTNNIGRFSKREYIGLDAQLEIQSKIGKTTLQGEYIWGTQPGNIQNSNSPYSSTIPNTDTYIRKFNGGYYCFIQEVKKIPIAIVIKYDWFDPNRHIQNDSIGHNGSGKADIAYSAIGLGILWKMNPNLRLTTYFDFVKNETSRNLIGYEKNKKDNMLTCRIQYKF